MVLHVANIDGNAAFNATADTFTVDANPAFAPVVNTAGVPLDQAVNGNLYTYTYATSPMLAGPADSGEVFDTDATTVTVIDSGTSQPVTGFTLTFSADKTAITGLNAPASSIANLTGPLNVTYTAVNSDTQSVTSTTPDTIHVANKPSVVTAGVPLSPTINGSAYVYPYATSPMSAGTNEAFDTAATTVTVVDTGTGNSVSGFTLGYNEGNTAITSLNASVDTVNSLTGPLTVIYHVTNTDGLSIDSTAADTIATDAINVTATSLPAGTVATTYTDYSFKTSGGLTVGSTGMSPDVSLGGLSSATFSDPNAGLSAIVQNNDVIVSGTPIAGHAGTLTLTLNLKTPDGLFTKTSTATLTIAATTPVVTAGALPNVLMGATYDSGPLTGAGGLPLVSPGVSEYFDENPTNNPQESGTTFSVINTDTGDDVTSLFHLVYSSSVSQGVGSTAVNNGHNVVSLVSDGVATIAGDLTVSFHVVNIDAVDAPNTTAGKITVGSVTGYLFCPTGDSVKDRPATVTSNLYSVSSGGTDATKLTTMTFNGLGSTKTSPIQLTLATISGGNLNCRYGVKGTVGSNEYNTSTPIPAGATGYTSDWAGTSCSVDYRVDPGTADNSCQITYSYEG